MKTLIVYYSFTQNNEKLAHHLQHRLDCDLVRIETKRKRTGLSIFLDLLFKRKPALKPIPYQLHKYEHIIFIAPVWAGKIATPLKSFLIDQVLNIKSYSFITVCGGGNLQQKVAIEREISGILLAPPKHVTELWTKDLLVESKKDNGLGTLAVTEADFDKFQKKIEDFVKSHLEKEPQITR